MKIQDAKAQPRTDRLVSTAKGGMRPFLPRQEISAAIRGAELGALETWSSTLSTLYHDVKGAGFVLSVLWEAWQRLAGMRVARQRERRAAGKGFRSELAAEHFQRRERRAEIDREAFQRAGGYGNLIANRNPMRILFAA